jgi:hypothetical protein
MSAGFDGSSFVPPGTGFQIKQWVTTWSPLLKWGIKFHTINFLCLDFIGSRSNNRKALVAHSVVYCSPLFVAALSSVPMLSLRQAAIFLFLYVDELPVYDLILMNEWPFRVVLIQYWVRNGVREFSDFFFLCKCWKFFWSFPSLYTLLYCGQSAKLF